jgi:DNA modification methylase
MTPGSEPRLAYETDLGQAWVGDSVDYMRRHVADGSVDLVVTSPPFALLSEKAYGNVQQGEYVAWFTPFADEVWRCLSDTGSFVIDLGGSWEPGVPVRSLYQFELLLALCRRPQRRFHLAQDFYWYNPARLPTPAAWVTVKRLRAKDAVDYIWWLSKTPSPKADNRRVLRPYTDKMKRLLETGNYNRGRRPSGHVIGEGFTTDQGGAIPPNLIVAANTGSDQAYAADCKRLGLPVHPARIPRELPEFFVDMLTEEGDLVLDPFAGSNMVGRVCEESGRKWLAVDLDEDYVLASRVRFENVQMRLDVSGAGA